MNVDEDVSPNLFLTRLAPVDGTAPINSSFVRAASSRAKVVQPEDVPQLPVSPMAAIVSPFSKGDT
ncbi:hypothetical protein [Rhizobium sp. BK376]|uniref:hypothetical protein n=1 Tax=Rhizobium sp. BK376 TaxID=2512149 RepID=UPI001043CAB8|nr:hypothetical protein [Rhizobium sp. BK376]